MDETKKFDWLISQEEGVESYKAGDVIFKAGESGTHMYVVRSGTVDITVGGKPVDTVEKGGIFGEMALIDDTARSADAVAGTDCVVLPVDDRKFKFLVHETPFFALDVMRTLASRLRAMNELL